jgi:hypothetical protein
MNVHHRADDVVDQQPLVLAFGHDADQRFGARLADQEAARSVEPRFGGGDGSLDRAASSGVAPAESGRSSAAAARSRSCARVRRRGLAGARHLGQELQPRDQAVAGGGIVGHHDMARLLAAKVPAAPRIASTT